MAKHVWLTEKVRSHCLHLWVRWLFRNLELNSWWPGRAGDSGGVRSLAHLLPHTDLPVFSAAL